MANQKKVLTTETFNGVVFRNFPAEEYMNDLYFSIRDEAIAEKIAKIITDQVPAQFRTGIEVDCAKIAEFNRVEEIEESTPQEQRILKWLDDLQQQINSSQMVE